MTEIYSLPPMFHHNHIGGEYFFHSCVFLQGLFINKIQRLYIAVLIGQLAVMDGFHGLDLGAKGVDFIKSWFIDPRNKTGCRYIIVDAINQKNVLKFYENNGFKYIFASDEEEMNYMSGIDNRGIWNKFQNCTNIFRKHSRGIS